VSGDVAAIHAAWDRRRGCCAPLLKQTAIPAAIIDRVRFARARLGTYEQIDGVVVLTGDARSSEPTLHAFDERPVPFADVCIVLCDRHHVPSRSALSQPLSALD
jgi:hypothetical protein